MRASRMVGWIAALLCTPMAIHAQDKKDAVATGPSRTVLANLQHEMKSSTFADPMKFSEFLSLLSVTFVVDEEAFREEYPDAKDLLNQEIHLRNLPAKATGQLVLRHAVKQLPVKSAYVIRAGKVEIVPHARTAKEHMLNQTFHADFRERRLDQALEELSDLTGVSIVVDAARSQTRKRPRHASTMTSLPDRAC